MADARQDMADGYERAAEELEAAAKHLRTAARHMREGEVPRACAHAFAALGHVASSDERVKAASIVHAAHARP